jgi:hypothetical protein
MKGAGKQSGGVGVLNKVQDVVRARERLASLAGSIILSGILTLLRGTVL